MRVPFGLIDDAEPTVLLLVFEDDVEPTVLLVFEEVSLELAALFASYPFRYHESYRSGPSTG